MKIVFSQKDLCEIMEKWAKENNIPHKEVEVAITEQGVIMVIDER